MGRPLQRRWGWAAVSGRLTHIGWDRGVFAEVVEPLLAVELGVYPAPTKTTTSTCGKRVASSHIDNQAATCPACRAEVVRVARTTLELLVAHPELRRHARDPQALVDGLLEDLARFGEPTPVSGRKLPAALPGAAAPGARPVPAAFRRCPAGAPVGGANPEPLPRTDAPPPPTTPPALQGGPMRTATLPPIPDRVAAGARLLDRERPGWAQQMDPDRLDLRDQRDCLLGQIYGCFDTGVFTLAPDLDLREQDAWAVDHGFEFAGADLGDDHPYPISFYADLTEAWRAELAGRRGGGGR